MVDKDKEKARKKRYKQSLKGKEAKKREKVKVYGLSVNDWDRMFAEQEGKCAICKTHQSELKKTLCVDHNHKTGKVRKLLCYGCNGGLGLFRDNKELLLEAIKYLEE